MPSSYRDFVVSYGPFFIYFQVVFDDLPKDAQKSR
jgi:hypothetical protein